MPSFTIYDQNGRRRNLGESSSAKSVYPKILDSVFLREVTRTVKSAKSRPMSPWELNLQRFLSTGGRKTSGLITRRPVEATRSAKAQLLVQFIIEQAAREKQGKEDPGDISQYLLHHRSICNFQEVELNAESRRPSITQNTNGAGDSATAVGAQQNGQNPDQVLKYSIGDVVRRIEENEGLGISTFTYLENINKKAFIPEKDDANLGTPTSTDGSPLLETRLERNSDEDDIEDTDIQVHQFTKVQVGV
ncbi:unnamed protein product [Calicophoron daubneyi]|uniref:Uncharacterized protein n=1 Tax=Calicophoron daubneyi TaxID=300641 RepID=A0AAV2TE74_CALDB